jgi:hypothetical protein
MPMADIEAPQTKISLKRILEISTRFYFVHDFYKRDKTAADCWHKLSDRLMRDGHSHLWHSQFERMYCHAGFEYDFQIESLKCLTAVIRDVSQCDNCGRSKKFQ